MRKFLPIIIFIAGVLVFAGVFVARNRTSKPSASTEPEEEAVIDIPFDKRPFTSLTPTADGHWLKLKIENISVPNAVSVDYELLYEVPGRPPQGVPGNVEISQGEALERELLLGSESSGKFRYDQGVEKGTLTLRFRNDKGRLVGKLSTDFHLQSNIAELSTVDGKFTFTLDKKPTKTFFVTMNTFGTRGKVDSVTDGPFGIFPSDTKDYAGSPSPDANVSYWDGSSWVSDNFQAGVYIYR